MIYEKLTRSIIWKHRALWIIFQIVEHMICYFDLFPSIITYSKLVPLVLPPTGSFLFYFDPCLKWISDWIYWIFYPLPVSWWLLKCFLNRSQSFHFLQKLYFVQLKVFGPVALNPDLLLLEYQYAFTYPLIWHMPCPLSIN